MEFDRKTILQARQSRLNTGLYKAGLSALVLNPGPSLTYLTGLNFHLMERPVVAIFVPHQPVTIILPELEAGKTEALPFTAQVFPYGEDPTSWPSVFKQAGTATELDHRKIGVEPGRLRFLELRLLESALPQATFVAADEPLAELRLRKDPRETELMRKAARIAQDALLNALESIRPGQSERAVAAELTLQILRHGSDGELPFTPIVSSGPNSANPHASPSSRLLTPGDLLVIDWGASQQGYFSDLTRTFAIGHVDEELGKIAQLVEAANAAGRQAARPGATAGEVDQAARAVIEAAGYGEFFIHRTGHGLGMEAHEPPYIRAGNDEVLQPGMTFTVEPGIYLPGRGGVRIEDDIVITENGCESLSDLPRGLLTIT
jgi:Xaa-Pro dipeptidase